MLEAVMTNPREIKFRETKKPIPGPGEVVINVLRIGICGSDIHVYHGLHPYTTYPVIQGHEFSGTISDIGPSCEQYGLSVGDLATVIPSLTCGECYPCKHSRYNICDNLKVMGFQTDGAAREFFKVPADHVITLPDGTDPNFGAMIEPVAVAVHAVKRYGNIDGNKVVVLGAGPIGNLVAQVSKALGASDVLVSEITESRRAKALECGLRNVIDPSAITLQDAIRERLSLDGADVIFECVGANRTISDAVVSARKGSKIIVVGVFGEKPTVDLGLVQDRELELIGTLMYRREDYEMAISLVDQKSIDLSPLVTHNFRFRDYLEAYKLIDSSTDTMKVMINVEQT
jgi:L-iditol 2-dehydrogenase